MMRLTQFVAVVCAGLFFLSTATAQSTGPKKKISPLEMKKKLEYVAKLQLATPRGAKFIKPGSIKLKLGKPGDPIKRAGFIDDGSVSITTNLNSQQQSDVLNSTLLAQLAADKAVLPKTRESDTENWYIKYREVLSVVGWDVPKFNFVKATFSGSSFSVNKDVVALLLATAADDEKAAVDAALAAIKAMKSDDPHLMLFQTSTTSPMGQGSFQLGVCKVDNNVVLMKSGCFYFSSTETVTNLLFFNFSSTNTMFYKSTQQMELANDVYSQVRQQIIQKLGANASNYIANLDI